jgi:hypothetical protein
MECAGRAKRRRRFRAGGHHSDWRKNFVRSESGVALRLPPQSKMARRSGFRQKAAI